MLSLLLEYFEDQIAMGDMLSLRLPKRGEKTFGFGHVVAVPTERCNSSFLLEYARLASGYVPFGFGEVAAFHRSVHADEHRLETRAVTAGMSPLPSAVPSARACLRKGMDF